MEDKIIPVFKPYMNGREAKAVAEVLKTGWIGMGPKTEEFEKKFSQYIGTSHAVGLNSCTEALHLAIRCLCLDEGEIITTPITFVSTAHAILYNGMKPVFADVEEDTLNIDVRDIERKITDKTRAIIPVHYGGQPCDMREIMALAKKHDLYVIEDCAHACGASYHGKMAGNIGDMGCFSFHAVKNLATGDGGMVTVNDSSLDERLRKLRWCGINKSTHQRTDGKYKWDYDIDMLGYKSHMNDITAAIGLVQLKKLERGNGLRRKVAARYDRAFEEAEWITPLRIKEGRVTSRHNYVVKVEKDREELIKYLAEHGVSAGVHYKPVYLHPYYKKLGIKAKTPVADRIWKSIITLPVYPDLKKDDVDKIIGLVLDFK